MRKIILIVGCWVFAAGCLLLSGGCNSQKPRLADQNSVRHTRDQTQDTNDQKQKPTIVTVADGSKFPEFLAGRWQWYDRYRRWEFVFEKDGTISSAVIDSGFIEVDPSKKFATQPVKLGGKAIYELGKWEAQYTPSTRELAVLVAVDHFHIDMKLNWLEGSSKDWFIGLVSEDGKTWEATWSSFPKNIACTPDCDELPVDYNDTTTQITFKKVEPKPDERLNSKLPSI